MAQTETSAPASTGLRRVAIGLSLAWVGLMAFLAVVPRVPEVPALSARQAEALAHLLVHGLFAGLLFLTLVLWPQHRLRPVRTALIAVAVPFAYGVVLEVLQWLLPVRSASLIDLAANGVGAVVGMSTAWLMVRFLTLRQAWTVVGAGTLGAFLVTAAGFLASDPTLPRVGDHWHAPYAIRICDEDLPPLAGTHGAIHTHGDGYIHIHPFQRSEAGRNATLALFMATSGGALTDDSLTLPSGERYATGDLCPDGRPGRLTVWANGRPSPAASAYVPRDGDRILLEFGP